MAFIPTLRCVRVALNSTLFGQDIVNTLWFSYIALGTAEPTILEMTSLGSWLQTWAEEQWLEGASQDLALQSIVLTRQESLTAPSIEIIVGGTVGLQASASLPSNNCLSISFKTAERGRSSRGRNYYAGIPRVRVTGNVVTDAELTDVGDAYDYLINFTPSSWNWVVVSHVSDGINRLYGLKQTITHTSFADNLLDVQRRRAGGRGS